MNVPSPVLWWKRRAPQPDMPSVRPLVIHSMTLQNLTISVCYQLASSRIFFHNTWQAPLEMAYPATSNVLVVVNQGRTTSNRGGCGGMPSFWVHDCKGLIVCMPSAHVRSRFVGKEMNLSQLPNTGKTISPNQLYRQNSNLTRQLFPWIALH